MRVKIKYKTILIVLFLIILISGNTNDKTISGVELHNYKWRSFTNGLTNEIGSIKENYKIEKLVNRFLRRWEIKGASIAVMKNDNLVYAQGFGLANEKDKILVEPFHLFRIASVSKLVTGVAIMKLVEENKLELNDKVFGEDGILNDSIYLNYKDKRVEDITVSQLLTHSAGWTTRWGDHLFIQNSIAKQMHVELPVTASQIIEFALSKKLHFKPGTWSSYTNLSYIVLGKIITKITGNSYEDYVNFSILYPLGIYNMKIGNNLEKNKFPNEVTYYEPINADSAISIYETGIKVPHRYGGTDLKALSSAGGWIATPSELLKLVSAIDNNNSKYDILSKQSVNQMINLGYKSKSMGWRGTNGKEKWWRTGSLAGTSALIKHQNDSISWAIVTNTSSWKGSDFTIELNKLMSNIVANVNEWPKRDLFVYNSLTNTNYSVTVNLQTEDSK
ncbi:MAG: beta-lactamase family protein [Chlorobi bacterium]|nr:beta-lactamase family protein [Chlorobiota bacterium]